MKGYNLYQKCRKRNKQYPEAGAEEQGGCYWEKNHHNEADKEQNACFEHIIFYENKNIFRWYCIFKG